MSIRQKYSSKITIGIFYNPKKFDNYFHGNKDMNYAKFDSNI